MADEAIEMLRPLIRQCANEREKAAFARLEELLASPETDRERKRREYVREKAPVILAGLAANANGGGSWNELRAEAKEQAGLIFDETEPETAPRQPAPLFNRATYAVLNGEEDG